MSEALVDLSLFSYSPTDDRNFIVPEPFDIEGTSERPSHIFAEDSQPTREFYAPRPHDRALRERAASKPLPKLPPRTICGPLAIPREFDSGGSCILNRMKRKRTNDSPGTSESNISRRRNIASPPRLLVSAPPPSRTRPGLSSELVWMPEEQMWLVVGEGERNSVPGPETMHIDREEPSQSINRTRSEPTTRVQSQWTATPPISPIQAQLRSLIEQRDEERLSPLFQEAMNSVPMEDTLNPPPPPSYEGIMRGRASSSESTHSAPTLTTPTPPIPESSANSAFRRPSVTRAASFGSYYTTAPSQLSTDSENVFRNEASRSRTDVPSQRPKLTTKNSNGWSAPKEWDVLRNENQMASTSGPHLDFLNHDPSATRSLSAWARVFARPKSTF